MLFKSVLMVALFTTSTFAQSLLEAIAGYPGLTNFATLLQNNPNLANALLSNANRSSLSLSEPTTVLIPSNEAFRKESTLFGLPYQNLTVEQLQPYLQYHLLVGSVTSTNLTNSTLTVPSFLSAEQYNNRSAGAALGADSSGSHNGQVVILSPIRTSSNKFLIRQLGGISAQGGFIDKVNLTALDGRWSGGFFQTVDSFLTLPYICSKTFQLCNQTSLINALNRTGLSAALDTSKNITCLGPSDQAFLSAGSPEKTANLSTLSNALFMHTLPEVAYSGFLRDGQEFTSLNNATIRVRKMGGEIWFNDAKVLQPDVITNNGLMHVLDRVMSPLDSINKTTSSTAMPSKTSTSSQSATASSASTSSAANMGNEISNHNSLMSKLILTALLILGLA